MNKIVENKYLDSLFKLMLFSAIFHMIILFVFAFLNKDIDLLNYFNIVGLNFIYLPITTGLTWLIISVAFAFLLYFIIFKFLSKAK